MFRLLTDEFDEIRSEVGVISSVGVTRSSTRSWFASIEILGVVDESLLFRLYVLGGDWFGESVCGFSSSILFFGELWSKIITVRFKKIPVVDMNSTARNPIWQSKTYTIVEYSSHIG